VSTTKRLAIGFHLKKLDDAPVATRDFCDELALTGSINKSTSRYCNHDNDRREGEIEKIICELEYANVKILFPHSEIH